MSDKFDPYSQWLGIPPQEQPAHYYKLLGLNIFEKDEDLIRDNADERMGNVRAHQSGKRVKTCQRILNELSAARSCLLNPKLRKIYDSKLQKIFEERKLPTLDVPSELLPEITLPDGFDPFSGTANLDDESDPLQPQPGRPVWPYVLISIFVGVMTLIVILLIAFQ